MRTWGVSLAKNSSQLRVPLTAREAKKSVKIWGLLGVMAVSAAWKKRCISTASNPGTILDAKRDSCQYRI